MTNRRIFIKQLTAASVASSIPFMPDAKNEIEKSSIRLLVRGDDMGKNYGRTVGFMKSHKEGILTSASIMATSVYFDESVRFCKENPALAAGVHITILDGTQRPVLSPEKVPSLVTPKGFFYENSEELLQRNAREEEMEMEMRAQIEKARHSGLHFVYLDWHRGVFPAAQQMIAKLCKEEKLILGHSNDGYVYGYKLTGMVRGEKFPSQVLPDGQTAFYSAPESTAEEQQSFFDALNDLKPGRWLTVCHPGWADPNRASTTKLLCSPKTKEIIKRKNIQLVSYKDIWEEEYG